MEFLYYLFFSLVEAANDNISINKSFVCCRKTANMLSRELSNRKFCIEFRVILSFVIIFFKASKVAELKITFIQTKNCKK